MAIIRKSLTFLLLLIIFFVLYEGFLIWDTKDLIKDMHVITEKAPVPSSCAGDTIEEKLFQAYYHEESGWTSKVTEIKVYYIWCIGDRGKIWLGTKTEHSYSAHTEYFSNKYSLLIEKVNGQWKIVEVGETKR